MKSNKKGTILIITAISAIFLTSLLALVIDIGFAYHERNALNSAVKSAWKAGLDKLQAVKKDKISSQDVESEIQKHVKEILCLNNQSEFANAASISVDIQKNRIIISGNKKIGLFFARAINFSSFNIKVSSGDF